MDPHFLSAGETTIALFKEFREAKISKPIFDRPLNEGPSTAEKILMGVFSISRLLRREAFLPEKTTTAGIDGEQGQI